MTTVLKRKKEKLKTANGAGVGGKTMKTFFPQSADFSITESDWDHMGPLYHTCYYYIILLIINNIYLY